MSDETMSVEPSADNGNVPVEAPSEQPIEPVIPAEGPKEAAPTALPEAQLFELPDGRKVDGTTLQKEWKENFLPDYTRKSQTLADIEKAKNNKPNETTEDPYTKPDYVPQSYREIIDAAKKELSVEQKAERQAEIDNQKAFEENISNQISELKKTDPNLSTDALFHHSNTYFAKYGVKFPDLKSAYSHMKDVSELTKTVQQTTAKNIAKRSDPVSSTGKASGVTPQRAQFQNARDFYQAIKGNS